MQRIKADEIALFAVHLEELETQAWVKKTGSLTLDERKDLDRRIEILIKIGERIGSVEFPSTIDQLRRIDNEIQDEASAHLEHPYLWHMFCALKERFMDDLSRCHISWVPERDADLMGDKAPFGQSVFDAFPSATVDIEQAGICLALERSTAAVFHLMRVMEVGLEAVARALGIPFAPSWEAYLRQIKPKLDTEWKDKPPDWKAEEPFFRDVYAHLHAVKLAWRNPTMHIKRGQTYSPEMASDVWASVRGFMRHLATKVSEQTPMRATPLVSDPGDGTVPA